MEKALKFLKRMKQTDTPYNFLECELDEAIADIEALQEENKILKHNYDVQVEYNNTAYKNYTNMVNSLEERIEAMKPKTCDECKYFRKSDKACFMSSQNIYIRPASIDFSGCGKHEPKDNA